MWSTKVPKLTLSFLKHYIQNKSEISTSLELDFFFFDWVPSNPWTVDSFRSANSLHVQSNDTDWMGKFPRINSFTTKVVPVLRDCDLCSKKNYPVHICQCSLQTISYHISKGNNCGPIALQAAINLARPIPHRIASFSEQVFNAQGTARSIKDPIVKVLPKNNPSG